MKRTVQSDEDIIVITEHAPVYVTTLYKDQVDSTAPIVLTLEINP